jgi:hypothetical protein
MFSSSKWLQEREWGCAASSCGNCQLAQSNEVTVDIFLPEISAGDRTIL